MTIDAALVLAASLTYLVATLVLGAYMLRFIDRLARAGTQILAVGAALHVAAVVARAQAGHLAFGLYDGFLLASLVGTLIWLLRQLKVPSPLVGAQLAPVATMVLYSLHVFHRESGRVPPAEVEFVTPIHIVASLVGFGVFAVAAVAAALEVLQEYRLKTKRIQIGAVSRLPSLRKLSRISHRAVIIGFPIYSVGMALGTVWFAQMVTPAVTRHLIMASFSWVLYALLVHARVSLGLKGRRAAVVTLATFASALFVVLLSALRMGG